MGEEEERGKEDVGGVALSAASRRKINVRKMDGENGGMGYRGQTEEEVGGGGGGERDGIRVEGEGGQKVRKGRW